MTDIEKLRVFFKENQRLPSYEEMKGLFDVASKNTVAYRIKIMIRNGELIKKGRHILLNLNNEI